MDMISEDVDILRVRLSPSRPVELVDFVTSCSALVQEYSNFAKIKNSDQGRLFIKEVRKGSIEIDLVTQAAAGVFAVTQTVMPFLESGNIIGEFVGHLKGVFDWLKNGASTTTNNYLRDTIKNAGDILAPVAKDAAASVTFSPIININGDLNAPIIISSGDSRLIRQATGRLLREISTPNLERVEDVVLRWVQARNNTNIKDKRYKSIIQSICDNEVSTVFSDKSMMAIFRGDKSFFRYSWLVTVVVERVEGVPKLYKIERIECLDE